MESKNEEIKTLGFIHGNNGILSGSGTDREVPDCGLLRDRSVLPGVDKGEEAEHPALAGYSEAERLLREGVDIISAGFPCQDISTAGKGAGIQFSESTGEAFTRSGLFGQVLRTIRLVRPRYALLENVAALLNRGMGTVLGGLAGIGHDAEWHSVWACDVGAPHYRPRIWIVAYPMRKRLETTRGYFDAIRSEKDAYREADQFVHAVQGRKDLPFVCRRHDGVSHYMDITKGIGNAVLPQIPERIGEAIAEKEGLEKCQ